MNRHQHAYAGLIYAQPSLLEGFARVLDVAGGFDADYDSTSDAEADHLAALADWYAVAADLHGATRGYATRAGASTLGPGDAGAR